MYAYSSEQVCCKLAALLHLDVSTVSQNMDRLGFRDFATRKQETLFAVCFLPIKCY